MTVTFPKDIISKVLSPAVNLWLHSQLDQVEQLQIHITGTNRQIIGGYIPFVFLTSLHPVYQGIHIAAVELTGENIKINLGQVIKGKPLRLLEPISITGEITLEETQFNQSLSSPLLSMALTDLVKGFWRDNSLEDLGIIWQNLGIKSDKLLISGTIIDSQAQPITPITLRSGLSLADYRTLLLHPLQIETATAEISLSNYEVDLGSQVKLTSLTLKEGAIHCCGSATVTSD